MKKSTINALLLVVGLTAFAIFTGRPSAPENTSGRYIKTAEMKVITTPKPTVRQGGSYSSGSSSSRSSSSSSSSSSSRSSSRSYSGGGSSYGK